MQLSPKERQKIYDRWHKELYQVDIQKSMDGQNNIHEKAIRYLDLDKDSRLKLLDIACGKGLFLKELKSYNPKLELYGVDISQVAVDQAKKIVDCNFQQSEGENLPFKDNVFDRIVCLGGLEYFQDPIKGAKEASRVLKKDGIAVFFVPNLMFLGFIWLAFRYGIMPTHGGSDKSGEKEYYNYNNEKFFTYKGWIDILERGNLSVIRTRTYEYIGNTKFADSYLLWFYNKILSKVIPFHLANTFIFVCKKNPEKEKEGGKI